MRGEVERGRKREEDSQVGQGGRKEGGGREEGE